MSGEHVPRVTLALPRGWRRVPLRPDGVRRRAVDALVARPRRGPSLPGPAREQVRSELRRAADTAARGGAQELAVAAPRPDRVCPLPGSLVVTVEPAGVPGTGPPPDGVEHAVVAAGRVARRVAERPATAPDVALPLLAVDYWVSLSGPDDDPGHVAVLAFATPLVALRASVLPVFDAVVASARASPGGRAGGWAG
ncbi:hypothetical protein [Aquipuribacter nitratireducens]|uniref:Uncharacterized protein n=1 Tax=Aquipuribacter nitratireducens TaxID=650104 RepID=A0ABW0GN04_9MICO